jgi:hypothetical protein
MTVSDWAERRSNRDSLIVVSSLPVKTSGESSWNPTNLPRQIDLLCPPQRPGSDELKTALNGRRFS